MARNNTNLRVYGDKSILEDVTRCIKEIYTINSGHQCSYKRGYGPNGLYCLQHDTIETEKREDEKIAKRRKDSIKLKLKYKRNIVLRNRILIKLKYKRNIVLRNRILIKLAQDIPTEKLHLYKLVKENKNG